MHILNPVVNITDSGEPCNLIYIHNIFFYTDVHQYHCVEQKRIMKIFDGVTTDNYDPSVLEPYPSQCNVILTNGTWRLHDSVHIDADALMRQAGVHDVRDLYRVEEQWVAFLNLPKTK
jgi:hypothetical protein